MDRRNFIKVGGTAAAGSVFSRPDRIIQREPMRIALVGTGVRGQGKISAELRH